MTGLLGSARAMAVGTVASRTTGFLRTVTLAWVLGVASVANSYNVANTTPNIIYELLLGGVLTSVVVPLLVRAAREDADGGDAYAHRLLSLVVLVLGVASVLLVVLAPLVVGVYADRMSEPDQDLAVVFARFFLPQVLFYGVGAVLGAVLNTRGSFAAPMWAPVLNNVVVIATGIVFVLLPGPAALTAGTITDTQIAVLGIGTSLGILSQTAALIPALRRVGFRLRLRLDLRGMGLRRTARLAGWVLVYVVANQLAYVVVVRLATDEALVAPGRGYTSYVYAFVLWQLPHAVVAVSVITALMPRLSRFAAESDLTALRTELGQGLRVTVTVLVPAAVGYLVLGRALATLIFAHNRTTIDEARFIGTLLGVLAVGLVAYSTYQLQLRAFYAMQDTRTPTLINLVVNATFVLVGTGLYLLLPPQLRVAGIAAGQAASFALGLLVCGLVLRRRIGRDPLARVLATTGRCLVATLPGALAAGLVALGVERLLGRGPLAALLTLALGGSVLVGAYLPAVRRLGVVEADALLAPVLRRLRRGGARRRP